MAQLEATRQPSWSPSKRMWVVVGVAWYSICFIGLSRLLRHWPDHKLPVALLVMLLVANAAANIFQFRMKRLDLAFFYLFPYWALLGGFLWIACPLDWLTCALFSIYAAYLVYATVWAHKVWQANQVR